MRQPDLRDRVRQSLAMGRSPKQIADRLAREAGRPIVGHESIYRFVHHRSAQKDYRHRLLPRAGSRRGRYARRGGSPASFIPMRRPIAGRLLAATTRQQPGHREADYMLFAACGHNVLVRHERTTRFTLLDRPPTRKAMMTVQRIARQLHDMPQPLRRTISFDNGTGFAEHHRLHDLGLQTFFCDVCSPWQKGGIGNTIGRLRRFLPRKTDLDTLTPHQLRAGARRINDTPGRRLDFQTPAEAFLQSSIGALQT